MIFVEMPVFTEDLLTLLPDAEYREVQKELLLHPTKGTLIPGSGGFRKLRWKQASKGKRGGVRIIYFWDKPSEKLYLIFIYKKSAQEDLNQVQVKVLKSILKEVKT